jgi:hypothetical protein
MTFSYKRLPWELYWRYIAEVRSGRVEDEREVAEGGRRAEDEGGDEDEDGDGNVQKREESPWRSEKERVK